MITHVAIRSPYGRVFSLAYEFLDRETAFEVAFTCGQVKITDNHGQNILDNEEDADSFNVEGDVEEIESSDHKQDILYSEDIW